MDSDYNTNLSPESMTPVYLGKRIVIQTFSIDGYNPFNRISYPPDGRINYKLSSREETVVTESHVNGTITNLRINTFSKPDQGFHTYSLLNYATRVKRLDLGCPVPVRWLFDWISHFTNLYTIHIGQNFFGECDDIPIHGKIGPSPNIHNVEINYNKEKHEKQDPITRRATILQLIIFLDLTSIHLTGLKYAYMVLPEESILEAFLLKAPKVKQHSTRTCVADTGVVIFSKRPPVSQEPKQLEKEPPAKIPRTEQVEKNGFEPFVIDLNGTDDDVHSMPTPIPFLEREPSQKENDDEDTDLEDDKKWLGGFLLRHA